MTVYFINDGSFGHVSYKIPAFSTQDRFQVIDDGCSNDCIFAMTDHAENYLQGYLTGETSEGVETYSLVNKDQNQQTAILWDINKASVEKNFSMSIVDYAGRRVVLNPYVNSEPGKNNGDPQLFFTSGAVPGGGYPVSLLTKGLW